jgi:hypothetical protein
MKEREGQVMAITLEAREQELKKRFAHPYEWGQHQSDERDLQTDFAYHIFSFDALLKEIEGRFRGERGYEELMSYGINRWYNFWTAKGIEQIFCSHPIVTSPHEGNDRLRTFRIRELNFDHKTSTYPRGFNHDLDYGQKHPRELAEWFYQHQSQQRRKHFENRIFVVLYASDGAHWKLKAELSWLSSLIRPYLDTFDPEKLFRIKIEGKRELLADVLWAVK